MTDGTIDWTPGPPPDYARRLEKCDPPAMKHRPDSLEEARKELVETMSEYLDIEEPAHMLLIRAMPGVGKTQAAIAVVDALAGRPGRIGYAGPRHDFFVDIIKKTKTPEQWYEWQPRQFGDEEKPQTCRYAPQITNWIQRGYDAMTFCAGVCGWDYVNKVCPYHAQKKRQERVMFIQHAHVAVGHPIPFDVLIGDENPASAFTRMWKIPTAFVFPYGMDESEPMGEIMWQLQKLSESEHILSGPKLIEALGGVDLVREALQHSEIPVDALPSMSIHDPTRVEERPYFYLPWLVHLLSRESAQAAKGVEYPDRIIVGGGHVTLLLRYSPSTEARHIIWLDATGRPEIYEELFGRPVQVYDATPKLKGRILQVVDRANGKSAISPAGVEEQTKNAGQGIELIERIIKDNEYQRPVVITYKDLAGKLTGFETAHFYAARGTNRYEESDAVFILGTPQSSLWDLERQAKMIWFSRDTAFDAKFTTRPVRYNYIDPDDGMGREYPVSGFWHDDDMRAVLEMVREDEIVQAAHRGRPVNNEVDIWLLTNVPIESLPPTKLLTMRDIMDAPVGVNIWKWSKVQGLLEGQNTITIADIISLGIHRNTAQEYIELIAALPGWELAVVKTGKGGRPPKIARRA